MSRFSDIISVHEAYRVARRLKEVERYGEVAGRRESAAEHVFSSMVLARLLLPKVSAGLDEHHVLLLLLYHDLVESEAGDVFILDEDESKEAREDEAARAIRDRLPAKVSEEFWSCWREFCGQSSLEARFVKAVDQLDPMFHSLEQPELWARYGFTAEKLRDKKGSYMKAFPELERLFEDLLAYAEERGIIPVR
ncbi:HD domain-containing protein [Candidatus Woesearchaeota archaeon]|nr:HD domain-containing protein [Candidatus Woesearchaeota archaeon]